MNFNGLLIIFSGGLTFGAGLIVFLRNKVDRSSQLFFGLTFIIALWALGLAAYEGANLNESQLFIGQQAYISGFLMVYFFWLFTYYYPFSETVPSKYFVIPGILYFVYLIFTIFIDRSFILETIAGKGEIMTDKYSLPHYIIYMIILSFYVIFGLKNLIKKVYTTQGIHSYNSKIMVICFLTSAVFIAGSDLILPLFGNFSLNWIGPVSLLPIVIGVARILSLR